MTISSIDSITSQRDSCDVTIEWYVARWRSMLATTAAKLGRSVPGGEWYTSAPSTIVGVACMSVHPIGLGWTFCPPSFRLSLSSTLLMYATPYLARSSSRPACTHCDGMPPLVLAHRLIAG